MVLQTFYTQLSLLLFPKASLLIERGKAPFGKAIPGGKVEYGETVENGIRREMMEEINLDLST